VRRYYYAHQTFIDYQLGRFFGELKTRGIWDDTGIIFHSDHGEHLGDFESYGKTTFLRGSGDVPIIIKPPQDIAVETGRTCSYPVQNADIPCTIATLAGLSPDSLGPKVDGASLLPLLRDPEAKGFEDRLIFGEYGGVNGSASVIGNDYRMIYYPQGGIRQVLPTFGDDSAFLSETPGSLPDREKALVQWLAERKSPIVSDGKLVSAEVPNLDEKEIRKIRRKNPLAWRGPLRYGKGYGGGYA
jgi:arylsulfatase A-like enzyme